ncbi:MAG: DeoR/GlpR family DNA-binding transcription regulator [Eubacterium sp.]|nr:DeoR/GlpR family DNA-binding transcription regulator [Eubacterium sp.]
MEQRRNKMVELINQKGNVSFAQLKSAFPNVSEMTLRTDLKALDEANRIVRIHGGAKSVQVVVGTDDFLNRRAVRNISEKKEIAAKALKLIRSDSVIFLDSGSTTTALAGVFPDQSNLIYTTGLSCVTELVNLEHPTVEIPGGKLNRYSMSVYGHFAIKGLEGINFDQAFMGVTCYSKNTGFTCGVREEAFLKQTVMRQSGQNIILMDSSKVEKKNPYSICGLADVDIVISDGHLPEDFLEECRKYNVEVL